MMSKPSIIAAITVAALTAACSPSGDENSRFVTIPTYGWRYCDTLSFTPQSQGAEFSGRIAIAVRHTDGYRYSNLWVEISHHEADTVRRDTADIQLADVYGRWFGEGTGASYMLTDTIAGHFTLSDTAPVQVRHIMRLDTLTEIEQVGVIFLPD